MNASNWNTLSWGRLTNPNMVGKNIIIAQYFDDMQIDSATIVGTGYYGKEHVLVVQVNGDDDISIITRDLKGLNWEAYEILEGF